MRVILGLALAILIIGGGIFFVVNKDDVQTDDISTSQHSDSDTDHDTQDQAESENTSGSTETAGQAQTSNSVSVNISNMAYNDNNITIKKGTTVTWTNKDSVDHDVAPDNPSDAFEGSNGLLSNGESYSFTFNTAGTYTYHCTPHPFMKGTVIVE